MLSVALGFSYLIVPVPGRVGFWGSLMMGLGTTLNWATRCPLLLEGSYLTVCIGSEAPWGEMLPESSVALLGLPHRKYMLFFLKQSSSDNMQFSMLSVFPSVYGVTWLSSTKRWFACSQSALQTWAAASLLHSSVDFRLWQKWNDFVSGLGLGYALQLLFWEKVSLGSPGWPWTCSAPASASQGLALWYSQFQAYF